MMNPIKFLSAVALFSAFPCIKCSCTMTGAVAFCNSMNMTALPGQIKYKALRVLDISDNKITSLQNANALR